MDILITGINGQDGSYLAELLLSQGHSVHGILRRNSQSENQTSRIEHIRHQLSLYYGDLTDFSSLITVLKRAEPQVVYNLAAQSHVKISFEQPIYTMQATGVGFLNLLEAVRIVNPAIKIFQASSSEMFGNSSDADGFQREGTAFVPVSPYGIAKLMAHQTAINYRQSYGMFVTNGIFFNHESPRRGTNFLTNKVCKTAVEISQGKADALVLGNLHSKRDWGYSKDYVRAMVALMELDKPTDAICATGLTHSVGDVVDHVFGRLKLSRDRYLRTDKKFERPTEIFSLRGDSTKLRQLTGWKPEVTFEQMLDEMTDFWLKELT
jgi:GDPmannose 4,6-dehydratase